MGRPDDCNLTPGQQATIRREAERALREAGALGVFPTPVDRIMSVAKVEEVTEDLLSPGLLAKIRATAEKAGGVLKRALSKVMGLFHASACLVYLDQSLIEVKKRFVRLHESAHGFLPWQRPLYAVVEDCDKSLDPEAADLFDREANVFASEVLFQLEHGGGQALRGMDTGSAGQEFQRLDLRLDEAVRIEEPPRMCCRSSRHARDRRRGRVSRQPAPAGPISLFHRNVRRQPLEAVLYAGRRDRPPDTPRQDEVVRQAEPCARRPKRGQARMYCRIVHAKTPGFCADSFGEDAGGEVRTAVRMTPPLFRASSGARTLYNLYKANKLRGETTVLSQQSLHFQLSFQSGLQEFVEDLGSS